MSFTACGRSVCSPQASGIIMVFTMGSSRPAWQSSSNTASSAAESELPDWMTGFRSSP